MSEWTAAITRVTEKVNNRDGSNYLGVTVALEGAGPRRGWFALPWGHAIIDANGYLCFGDNDRVWGDGDKVIFTAGKARRSDDGNTLFFSDVQVDGLPELPPELAPPAKPSADTGIPVPQHEGTFTVRFEDGTHRTIRIDKPSKVSHSGANYIGWTFVKLLTGADNNRDFTGFLYAKPDQATLQTKRGAELTASKGTDAVRVIAGATDQERHDMGATWASEAGRCYRCRRKLTEPQSIIDGVGPICAAKGGF